MHTEATSSSKLTLAMVAISSIAILLLVIPVLTNFMVNTKSLVLFITAIALLGLFVWQTFRQQSLALPQSPLLGPIALSIVAALAASFLTGQYPDEHLLGLGGVLIAGGVIALTVAQLATGRQLLQWQKVVTWTGVALVIITVVQAFGMGPSRIVNSLAPLNIPHTQIFNLAGSPFIAAQVLGILSAALVVQIVVSRELQKWQVVALPALLLGALWMAWLSLPGKETTPLILPFGVSWSVAVEVLKSPRTALIGVGPENFASVYHIARPLWTNGTEWWSSNFGQGANTPLTLLATTGLLGLSAWLWLAIVSVKQGIRNLTKQPWLVGLVLASLAAQLLFPLNIPVMLLLAVGLGFLIAVRDPQRTVHFDFFRVRAEDTRRSNTVTLGFAALATLVVVGILGYFVGRGFLASYVFFKASLALQANDATRGYQLQQQAIVLNPKLANFRTEFAITNLSIATALANKADLTDQERQLIIQLIQESIQQARAATILKPSDYQTWRVLAQVYQNVIGVAEGAEQWAVNSYVRAIEVNPLDPGLRLELGGIFLSQQQVNDALLLFQQAANLKPDLPSAWYNQAIILVAMNQLEAAKLAYQQTLLLLPEGSDDFIQVSQELAALEEQIQNNPTSETGEGGTTSPLPGDANSGLGPLVGNQVSSPESVVTTPPQTVNPSELQEVTQGGNGQVTSDESAQPTPSPTSTPEP